MKKKKKRQGHLLCKFKHKTIICADGLHGGYSEVCLRPNCNYKKILTTTDKVEKKYQKQLDRG